MDRYLLLRTYTETILVLGNGFDIAHGLPTSYIDFIKFEQIIKDSILKVV